MRSLKKTLVFFRLSYSIKRLINSRCLLNKGVGTNGVACLLLLFYFSFI